MIKALKEFRVYILHSHTIAYVPSSAIKEILTQSELEGRRAKWIDILLEYDLEIKPTKMIKGQGLEKMMVESNCDVLGINFMLEYSDNKVQNKQNQVCLDFQASLWYKGIIYVLQNLQAPPELNKEHARAIKLKFVKFWILNDYYIGKTLEESC